MAEQLRRLCGKISQIHSLKGAVVTILRLCVFNLHLLFRTEARRKILDSLVCLDLLAHFVLHDVA